MFDFVNKAIKKIFGDKNSKDIAEAMPLVEQIKAEHGKLGGLSHDDLRNKTDEFRARVKQHLAEIDEEILKLRTSVEDRMDVNPEKKEEVYNRVDKLKKKRDEEIEVILAEILPEAFAVVKETAKRFMENERIRVRATDLDRDLAVHGDFLEVDGDHVTYKNSWMAAGGEIQWNMVHYDVQLIGGIVLHQGKIAEMATGEGKTLVATLPAYLNGLTGEGVHIITVNTYLAQRDQEWMAPIFNFLGLTIDCIDKHRPNSASRRKAYQADITYGTNNEFGFDYLRDNMVREPEELVQRKHHYTMIDEVDSVLIDDARTPLIISGPVERSDTQEFGIMKPRIEQLLAAQRKLVSKYLADAKRKIKAGDDGAEEGEGGLDLFRAFRGLPKTKALIKYLSEPGVKQTLLKSENTYLEQQQRRMPEADEPLLFTIDEKTNQVNLTENGIEVLTRSGEEKDFFVMTDIGADLAVIENSNLSAEEKIKQKDQALQNFSMKSERLHTINQLLKAYTLFEKDVEYVVMDGKVKIVDEQTGRIMDGRRYSDGLHQAIEAKESVEVEAATQTMATVTLQNYFRMYHKLAGMTGTAETEAGEFWDIYKLDCVVIPTNRPIARDDKDDLVFRTVREKFNAVIDEISELTAAGRPVLVGTTSVEISELLSRMMTMRNIEHNVLNAKQHAREAEIVAEAGQPGKVTIATNMAGRGTDIKLSDQVKAAGGLAIIGTERHESRRVDRQLRGRAGRQGDPGSSQFYVSLEDNLMRLFGSEKITRVMDKMGYQEGEVIQHGMISKSIERAQKKVEENHFGVRKRLLEYDDVMNKQREVIYTRRRHALMGERLSVDVSNMTWELCQETIQNAKDDLEFDFEEYKLNIIKTFAMDTQIREDDFRGDSVESLTGRLYDEVNAAKARKEQAIIEKISPWIKDTYENRGETVKNIVVPFTDGVRQIPVVTNLEKAYNSDGRYIMKSFEKAVILAFIDDEWKEHLRQMDDLKQAVQNASIEQKDPLVIYKLEGFNLFKAMLSGLNEEAVSFLYKGNIPIQEQEDVQVARQPQRTDMSQMQSNRAADGEGNGQQRRVAAGGSVSGRVNARQVQQARQQKPQPKHVGKKIGRNEECPCGSGKKYKNCHGKASA